MTKSEGPDESGNYKNLERERVYSCHSEEAERPKNLTQDRLREESRPFPFVSLRVRVTK
jgi:hypothetical protein